MITNYNNKKSLLSLISNIKNIWCNLHNIKVGKYRILRLDIEGNLGWWKLTSLETWEASLKFMTYFWPLYTNLFYTSKRWQEGCINVALYLLIQVIIEKRSGGLTNLTRTRTLWMDIAV